MTIDYDKYLALEPIIPIKLRGKDYNLELNNYAVKGIFQDTGHNLLSQGFLRSHMQDPKIMGSMLFWGLKTHHPEVTQEEIDKLFTYKHAPYILDKLTKCLQMFAPDEKKETLEEEVKEETEDPT